MILVIERHKRLRQALALLIQGSLGVPVAAVARTDTAVRKLRAAAPQIQVVVVDGGLLRDAQPELLAMLESLSSVPLIVLSVGAEPLAWRARANSCIGHPIEMSQLLGALTCHLRCLSRVA